MNNSEIGLVIILYHPTEEDILNVRHLAQSWKGVIVDNSDTPFTDEGVVGNMIYVCNRENLGIAKAQNIAMCSIIKEGFAKHIVMLDQDSRISLTYPADIVKEFERIRLRHPLLVMLGPTLKKKASEEEYASAIHNYQTDEDGFSQRRQIVCSGCCVSVEAVTEVGLMDSGLYIDYVDFEWCWRAVSKGYVCGITQNLTITHQVGSRELSFGKYKVIVSAPFRYYYQYRNYFLLLRKKYVPAQWKFAFGIKLAARFLYFPLIVKGGRERWKYMLKGSIDGIRRKIT